MLSLRTPRALAGSAAVALIISACGAGNGDSVEVAATSDDQSTAAAADGGIPDVAAPVEPSGTASAGDEPRPVGPNELPAVTVRDIATGDEVDLAGFAPADRPIVLWFWAPH